MAIHPINPLESLDHGLPEPHESENNIYTDAYLVEVLQTLHEELGRGPTVSDVRNLGEKLPDVSTFERHFGSWIKALEAAGIEGAHNRSDETILRQLADLAIRLGGRAPTKREVDADPSVASSGLYRSRFGTFGNAVEQALELMHAAQNDNMSES